MTLLRVITLWLFSFLLVNCASLPKKIVALVPKTEVEKQISQSIHVPDLDQEQVVRDIKRFRSILRKQKPLTKAEWQLHDSLLDLYIGLKHRPQKNILRVPAKTKLTVSLNSYCLDGNRANPQNPEIYQWKKYQPHLEPLYLKEILQLSEQKKYPQNALQELIWNLKNKTYWENYPEQQKNILISIDPKAALKIPSKTEAKIKEFVIDEVGSQIPLPVKRTLEIIKGPYYDYEDFKEKVETLTSNEFLPTEQLSLAEDTSLYTENKSEGFSKQEVSFYNTSNEAQTLDLTQYEQIPLRSDVQALAAYYPSNPWDEIFKDLENLLYGDMTRYGLGYIPVLGDLIDLYEASMGKDFFSDEWLTPEDRFLSGIGVLAGSGDTYRQARKILYGPKSYVSEVHKKYRHIRNTKNHKVLEKLSEVVRGKGIPDDYIVKVSKKEKGSQGFEFIHPDNEHRKIRVMPGNPNSPHKVSQKPYVRVQKDGKYLDKNGDFVKNDSSASHIPLDEFDFKKIRKIFEND